MFLDSGAHSLYTREVIKKEHKNDYAFYRTPEFWAYVDSYCEFLKENIDAIDYYANVDAIFEPKLSWKVLKYMEKEHGLTPVPVIHWGTPLEWIKKHIDAGYEFLGLGGLGQEVTRKQYYDWADKVYDYICPRPSRLPIVRTHGFAMTAYELLFRYPWWSVDSASWVKSAGFGAIFIPRKRNGKFVFHHGPRMDPVYPYGINVSEGSPAAKIEGRHIKTLSRQERMVVEEWLEFIDVPLGTVDERGDMVEWGIISHHGPRKIANLKFFDALTKSIPEWPWALKINPVRGFFG